MIYDIAIIGGGPAGLTAGIYASRGMRKTAIFEKAQGGGQIINTLEVDNYPGTELSISGRELITNMEEQNQHFGTERIEDEIIEVDFSDKIKILKGEKGQYKAKTVIIATGGKPNALNIPGEKEFLGRGLSYCATCDGAFSMGMEVFVIGGGDSAVEEAIQLTKYAKKVNVVHRRDELRADKYTQELAFENEKINFMWDTVLKEIRGNFMIEELILENVKTGEIIRYEKDEEDMGMMVFPYIGFSPETKIFGDILEIDETGHLIAGEDTQTSVEGVFVAGDNRAKPLYQVITAAADGAVAAKEADKYIIENFN